MPVIIPEPERPRRRQEGLAGHKSRRTIHLLLKVISYHTRQSSVECDMLTILGMYPVNFNFGPSKDSSQN